MPARPDRKDAHLGAITPAARVSIDDVRDSVTDAAFRKAQSYQRQGKVTALVVSGDGRIVTSRVRGTEPRPYTQSIRLESMSAGSISIDGDCSCPVGYNCKHVAAALLKMLARRPSEAATGGPANAPASGSKLAKAPQPPAQDPLDSRLAQWIDTLVRLETRDAPDYPPDVHQRIVYVIDIDVSGAGAPVLVVAPMSVRLLKNGSFSDKASLFDHNSLRQNTPPRFVRAADRRILDALSRMSRTYSGREAWVLAGEKASEAIVAMIETGRARWRSISGPEPLLGSERKGRFVWRATADGAYSPGIAFDDGEPDAETIALVPPWYVMREHGVLGPVDAGLPPHVASGVLSGPPVPASQMPLLAAAMEKRLPHLAELRPPPVDPPNAVKVAPAPGLRLKTANLVLSFQTYAYGRDSRLATGTQLLLARPFHSYGEFEVDPHDKRERPAFGRDGAVFEIIRDTKAEVAAARALFEIGLERVPRHFAYLQKGVREDDLVLRDGGAPEDWLDFLYHDAPELRRRGWTIEIDPDFPVRLVQATGDFDAELRETTGIDWFELDLGVVVEGERIDLAPTLFRLISDTTFDPFAPEMEADLPAYLPLQDGRILAVPMSRLMPFIRTIRELFDGRAAGPDGRFAIRRTDAAALAELEGATAQDGVTWRGGEKLRDLGRALREAGGIPHAPVPAGFKADLRPYQQRGVDWLQFLRAAELGGVLADDMGLGKTIQTLAHLSIEKAAGRLSTPALIVTPTSLTPNWRREAERFAPDLGVLVLHGADRQARFDDISKHDVVLSTYPLLARDQEILAAQSWSSVVLDEAQTIKNPNATTTRIVSSLKSQHRLCLTGTPIENHLGELWSLFDFLSPGLLGDAKSFNKYWRRPIEKGGDRELGRRLARKVRPFMLRRTKADVAADLPPKTEIIETVEMERGQRALYDSVRLAMHEKVRQAIAVRGMGRSRIVVLDALLKLRQTCCDPRLLKIARGKGVPVNSAKLDRLMEILPQLIGEGRRIVLFSQFTSMLALIETELNATGLPFLILTGDTRDRDTPVRRFQAGEVPLFLISLKAGGVGLNLTAADTVIHYDPWWNPAVEDQATDRAHRIGQDKPVFVHKLMVANSIEEKMDQLKARKRDLAAGLFDPDAGSIVDLTEADIDSLFDAD